MDFQLRFAALVIAVALLTAAQSVSAIKCYQCNSLKDPHCPDVKANISASASYLRECEDPDKPSNATFFCRKIVQTLLAMDGEQRVVRKCGYVKSEKACYHYDSDDHGEVVCQCFEDACNAAARPPGPPSWIAALAAASSASLLLALAR